MISLPRAGQADVQQLRGGPGGAGAAAGREQCARAKRRGVDGVENHQVAFVALEAVHGAAIDL
jgi:hypothetical protein